MKLPLKKNVLETALAAYKNGLMAGTSGNFSAIDRESGVMVITPSSVPYTELHEDEMSVIDLNGLLISGMKPSSEWQMHLEIYRTSKKTGAIAHTHSPFATSFAVLNESIPTVLIEMALLGGEIPVAPFAMPGSIELGVSVAETLNKYTVNACLLESHGALAIGETMTQAYTNAVYLEDVAKIYHYARAVGQPKIVKETAIQQMLANIKG
ncbi:class II aldolase/adducin family protein [Enterococcus crotali]